MKQMFLRTLTTALLVCGGAAAAQETVTLLFWPGPESEAMQAVVDAYNEGPGAEAGVEVEQLLFSRQGYFEKELADLAAGSTEFDLALVTTYSLGRYSPYLEPLGDYLSTDPSETFIPTALTSLQANDQQFGVPTDVSLHFTYYRQDLIDQLMSDEAWGTRYGDLSEEYLGTRLEPTDPQDWTWDDYLATSLFFTQAINPDSPTRFGTALQLKNLIFNIMLWQSTMVSNGGDLFDDSGSVTIDSEAARRGLEIYQLIIDNGATPSGSLNAEYAETNEAFRSGQVATILQWNAAYNELNNPELSPQVAGKIGIAPLPAGSEGHRTHTHSLGIGMNAASTKKEAAGSFIDYLFTQAAMEVYAGAGGTPPVAEVLAGQTEQRPEFAQVADYLDQYAYVVNGGTAAYAVPVYEILAEELSGVWADQQSIDEALQKASERMTEAASQ